jgi:hypothetical protein
LAFDCHCYKHKTLHQIIVFNKNLTNKTKGFSQSSSQVRDKGIYFLIPVSKMLKSLVSNESKTLLSIETFLEEKDFHIFYLKVSFDLYELHNQSQTKYTQLNDSFSIWGSNLAQLLVLQVYNFPKFVHWCAQRYISSRRSLVKKNGTVLFDITNDFISQMIRVSKFKDGQVINEETLVIIFNHLSIQER